MQQNAWKVGRGEESGEEVGGEGGGGREEVELKCKKIKMAARAILTIVMKKASSFIKSLPSFQEREDCSTKGDESHSAFP